MSNRIGVYICHCGSNIAGKVDCSGVAEYAGGLRDVVVARDYQFMCSDPGQDLIIGDVRNLGLTRVVVASCSPRLHEKTFQKALARAGLNPYMLQHTCIREHCSWVTENPDEATAKAMMLVAAAVDRVGRRCPGPGPGRARPRVHLADHELDQPGRLRGLPGLRGALPLFGERRKVAVVNEAMCKGCGSCAGYCPSGAAQIKHFNEPQVFSELEGLLSELRGAGGPAVRIKVEDGARDKMTT